MYEQLLQSTKLFQQQTHSLSQTYYKLLKTQQSFRKIFSDMSQKLKMFAFRMLISHTRVPGLLYTLVSQGQSNAGLRSRLPQNRP